MGDKSIKKDKNKKKPKKRKRNTSTMGRWEDGRTSHHPLRERNPKCGEMNISRDNENHETSNTILAFGKKEMSLR